MFPAVCCEVQSVQDGRLQGDHLPKCSKENQDHYKFCLGCGAELPRDASPKQFAPHTPPHGMKAAQPVQRLAAGASSAACGLSASAGAIAGVRASRGATSAASGAALPRRQRRPPWPPARSVCRCTALPLPAAGGAPAPAGSRTISVPAVRAPQPGEQQVLRVVRLQAVAPSRRAAAPRAACAHRRAAVPRHAASGVVLTALRADGSEAGTYPLPRARHHRPRHRRHLRRRQLPLAAPRHLRAARRQALRQRRGLAQRRLQEARAATSPSLSIQTTSSASARRSSASSRSRRCRPRRRRRAPRRPSKGYVGRIALIIGRDATGNASPFPEARHPPRPRARRRALPRKTATSPASTAASPGRTASSILTDLGSSNGTFIALHGRGRGRQRRRPPDGAAAVPHQHVTEEPQSMEHARSRHHPRRRRRPRARRALPHHPAPARRGAPARCGSSPAAASRPARPTPPR